MVMPDYMKNVFMLVIVLGALDAYAESPSKPNILLIMADDIAYDNVGCYGSEHFKTPRLDELARTGIKYSTIVTRSLSAPPAASKS